MNEFYTLLLNHGALWKQKNGNVIYTAMPYGDKVSIINNFNTMTKMFCYPETLKLQFLDNKYRYRTNGDYMIVIYCKAVREELNPNCYDEELCIKVIQHSATGLLRYLIMTKSYFLDRYYKANAISLTKHKHEFIICTHIGKRHLYSHIVFDFTIL